MADFSRMPRYDIRNDGAGPYAIFYCDACGREFRSRTSVVNTMTQDLGRQVMGGLLRKVPLVGNTVANNMADENPRYTLKMTPAQIEEAWRQAQEHFRECPTCQRIVCLSDFDTQSGYCNEDTPRSDEIAEARGEQVGATLKGLASAFGLGEVMKQAQDAAKTVQHASTQLARCPKDGTMAAPGTKFCPECGTPMAQPAATRCPGCNAETHGAKFCPECGAKQTVAQAGVCPGCGADTKSAKFCPECGTKQF